MTYHDKPDRDHAAAAATAQDDAPARKLSRVGQNLVWLRCGELKVVWPDAQRPPSERRAKEIADALDPDILGTLTVCETKGGGGAFHVIDGQTRRRAVELAFGPDQRVPCVNLGLKTKAQAARIFVEMNGDRTKPTAHQIFMGRLTEGAPRETAVAKLCESLGFRIQMDQADGSIRSVAAVLRIHDQKPDLLRDVLLTLRATFGIKAAAVDQVLLSGYAAFLTAHAEGLNHERLVKQVAKKFNPERLIGAGRTAREMFGGRTDAAVKRVLVETYNAGLSHGRIEAA